MHYRLLLFVCVLAVAGLRNSCGATEYTRGRPIAIMAALDSELSMLKGEVEVVGGALNFEGRPVWQARFHGASVLLARAGANPEAAGEMARWLIMERDVKALISIGSAGALDKALEIGDMVFVRETVDSRSWVIGRLYMPGADDCSLKIADRILTVDRFVASAVERDELRQKYRSNVVDMSAASIALAAEDAGIPCVIIREITDRADEEAPRAFLEAVQAGQPRTIPAALCAIKELHRTTSL